MPKKVREIKAMLLQLGYRWRPAKGSHTLWSHPKLSWSITIAGKDGADARDYLENQVKRATKELKQMGGIE
jgi:predicted RNA binding protein YcfA (HicA-like mRNA interferase family)